MPPRLRSSEVRDRDQRPKSKDHGGKRPYSSDDDNNNMGHTFSSPEAYSHAFSCVSSSSSPSRAPKRAKLVATISNKLNRRLDPISLNQQTLELREHLHGPADIVLVAEEVRFAAHKSVLVAHSLYFQSMLEGPFAEQNSGEVELKEFVEPALMGLVLHFLYFKNVHLTIKNVQGLLGLSSYLQVEELRRRCSDYVRQRITRNNCVDLYLYTLSAGPAELRCHAEDFILTHFEQVVGRSKDFAKLSQSQLRSLISSNRLLVSGEGAVYKAVMRWVQHDAAERTPLLGNLLEHVHFPLMSANEVEQWRRDSRVKKSKNLSVAFDEAKRYLEKRADEKIKYWTDKPKPARWPKIFVVMRMYWKNLPMEYYDFRTRKWSELTAVQQWRSCAALVSHRSNVYLVGGEETDSDSPTGSRTVNRVTRYDCEMQKWSSAPSMNLARRWAAGVVLDDALYVVGGIGGKGGTYERRLDTVECLDLTVPKGKWKLLASMSTSRSSHTVEVLDGKIYVVGGGDGREWLCTSEVYCPKRNRWSLIANLRTKRWKCGLCVLNGYLYAVGGMDSPNAGFWGSPLKSVERYFPATDEWQDVSPMNEARFGSAVVAHQGKMYVSGGFGVGKSILSSTEVYDPATDKWARVATMKKMCGFVGGVLVDRPIHFDANGEGNVSSDDLSSFMSVR